MRSLRRDALAIIRRRPGLTLRGMSAALGTHPTLTKGVLADLIESGKVRREKEGPSHRYVAASAKVPYPPELVTLGAWIKVHPGARQKDILDLAQSKWRWPRSTTQHRLGRLVAQGRVEVVWEPGRQRAYRVSGSTPTGGPGQS